MKQKRLFSFGYQVQDGGQDLVNSLNLVCSEADDFHGVGDGLEVSAVVDAGLRREETERWKSSTITVCQVNKKLRTNMLSLALVLQCASHDKRLPAAVELISAAVRRPAYSRTSPL